MIYLSLVVKRQPSSVDLSIVCFGMEFCRTLWTEGMVSLFLSGLKLQFQFQNVLPSTWITVIHREGSLQGLRSRISRVVLLLFTWTWFWWACLITRCKDSAPQLLLWNGQSKWYGILSELCAPLICLKDAAILMLFSVYCLSATLIWSCVCFAEDDSPRIIVLFAQMW